MTCPKCAKPLTDRQVSDRRVYCSRGCANKHRHGRVYDRACERCEKTLTRKQHWQRQRFCSSACANASMRVYDRTCPQCAKPLTKAQHIEGSRCCSRECAREFGRLKQAVSQAAILAVLKDTRDQWLTASDLAFWVYGEDTFSSQHAIRAVIYRIRQDGVLIESRRLIVPDGWTWAVGYRLVEEPASMEGAA